ncbi:MAG: histidine phosphatase family protein [Bacteriovorax sp.]
MNRMFYIFRHGETDWNRERRCQGHTNTCLNSTGKEQAMALAEKMLDFPLDVVVTSDLARARETGSLVARKLNVPLIVDSRLREMSYGEAEGMLFEDAIKVYGAELWQRFQSFNRANDYISFPGGETRFDARERFLQAMLELIEATEHKTIGISTHGGALRNVLHSFLPETHPLLSIPNCVVYRCEYDFLQKQFFVDPRPI